MISVTRSRTRWIRTLTNFQDEAAIEVYYNWAVSSWLRLGANIQYINPARGDYENALVPSLRAQIRF